MKTRFAHAVLWIALLACPRAFRDEYGAEIEADFADRSTSAGSRLWLIVNLLCTGAALRVEDIARDLGFALRTFAKAPALALIAVAAIALAIGVNVTVGSVTEHLFLSPLPYPAANRLLYLSSVMRGERQDATAYPDVRDVARESHAFSALGSSTDFSGTMTGRGSPLALHGRSIAGNYFAVLQIRPEFGRLLDASDPGKRRIVISDELWRKRFDADSRVLGSTVTIEDRDYTIVGVLPPRTLDPSPDGTLESNDVWLSIDPHSAIARQRGWYAVQTIGRLAPGASITGASADAKRIADELRREYPQTNRHRDLLVMPLADALLGTIYPLLLILHAAALIVFLVAAANVAGLLLTRATTRELEFAVRRSMGATDRRIAGQLVTETLLLVVAGSLAGILLGGFALAWIRTAVERLMPAGSQPLGWQHLGIDPLLLAYIVTLAVAFTVFVGLLPLLVQRRRLTASAAHRSTASYRVRRVLVTAEMALAFVLVVMAGLLVRSFAMTERLDVGFDGTNLYWVDMPSLPNDRYAGDSQVLRFVQRLDRDIRTIPGVVAAGEAMTPIFGSDNWSGYRLPGEPQRRDTAPRWIAVNAVVPGYFETLRLPLLRGRDFDDRDIASSQPVAIVSRAFAMQAFGTLDVIGRDVAVAIGSPDLGTMRRIVGVVGDVRHHLAQPPAREVYLPFAQGAPSGGFAVRTNGDVRDLGNALTTRVHAIDPRLPPVSVASFASLRALDILPTSFSAIVLATVALIALLLALSGVYGVVAYSVERRTREFGIRIALGARPERVLFSIVRETLLLAVVALAAGLVVASVCTRALAGYLVDTSPLDASTFVVVAALIVACSFLACIGPAHRTMSIAPADALRYE